MMKVGVLSDTHLYVLTKELIDICEKYMTDVDVILHAGDHVSVDVVEFLSKYDFHGVHGNMDPHDVRRMLPKKRVIELGSHKVALIHGWGSSEGLEDRIRPQFDDDIDVIVYGHSHRAANHVKDGVLFFNPGTAIGYDSFGAHTIGILEIGDTVRGKIINL